MLKFKVDENLPAEIAILLVDAGHDALTVPDQKLGGRGDQILADACRQEGGAVVTLDLDFADIRAYPPADYAGIVVMRLWRLEKHHIIHTLQRLLPAFEQEQRSGKLWIVDESTVRIRS
jgi:predicted nuclease of predicted toxin-antitoxin system